MKSNFDCVCYFKYKNVYITPECSFKLDKYVEYLITKESEYVFYDFEDVSRKHNKANILSITQGVDFKII